MRNSTLISASFAVTWICAAEGVLLGAALALGGLAALKGAALVGLHSHKHKKKYHHRPHYYMPHYHTPHFYGRPYRGYRKGRSVDASFEEYGEDILLSTVEKLDPNGCILKLLCQAHIKGEEARSLEEAILVDMFSNSTETLTSYNTAFVFATDIGVKTQDPSACKKYFPKCPMDEGELSGLLQMAWGCGVNVFEESEEEIAEEESRQEVEQITEGRVPTNTTS
ncbi:uncharacterized protein [Palaemon carinicauda]|uniref:uncharacterized protein n=1 Tax=Palaemon carinicauda TaxID=392227 RepID=UPI0035B5C0C8